MNKMISKVIGYKVWDSAIQTCSLLLSGFVPETQDGSARSRFLHVENREVYSCPVPSQALARGSFLKGCRDAANNYSGL